MATGKFNWIYWLAFSLLALSNMACSVKAIPDKDPVQQSTSWEAYRNCLNTVGPTNSSICNNVGMPGNNGMSYAQYAGASMASNPYSMYASTDGSWDPARRAGFKAVSGTTPVETQAMLESAYQNYLSSLDPSVQAALAQEWNRTAQLAQALR